VSPLGYCYFLPHSLQLFVHFAVEGHAVDHKSSTVYNWLVEYAGWNGKVPDNTNGSARFIRIILTDCLRGFPQSIHENARIVTVKQQSCPCAQVIRLPESLGYNWENLFLGEINRGTWHFKLGVPQNYGHEYHGTQARERMRWRGPATIVNYGPILSSERAPHNKIQKMFEDNVNWKERIKETTVGELRTVSAVTGNRTICSLILVTLMMEAIRSSETSVLTKATRSYISEDDILHSHRRENLKSYIALTVWTL
jgi:hypothetical protein